MSNQAEYQKGFSTISLVIGIGAAIILGFGAYLMMRPATPAEAPTSTEGIRRDSSTETVNLTDGELATTMPDIIGRGQSLECDWKLPADSAENPFNKGKLWTTGNKGRSTIKTEIGNMPVEANALYQGNTAYTWMEFNGQKFGTKFSPTELEDMNSRMTPQERQQAEQTRASMIFNCKPWAPDETIFTLPTDVEFKEN